MQLSALTVNQLLALGFAVGAFMAGVIVFTLCRSRLHAEKRLFASQHENTHTKLHEREQLLAKTETILEQKESEIQTGARRVSELQSSIAALQTELDLVRTGSEEKLRFQEEERARLKHEFENLAQKILDEKSAKFTQQNMQNIGTVLNPLREQMGDFKKRVEDVYDKESRDRAYLANEIKNLKGLNERISQDAINLTNALKGDSKTRGNWGEIVLERILEDAGLREGAEFEREVLHNQESGERRRPDVVIHLPDKHDLVVDAKVSLAAFEEAMSLNAGDDRDAAINRHVLSLRGHVRELSQKSYQTLTGINTLDFVLMFVPIEPALHTAFAEAPELFQEAYDKNIFIVSPTTLLMACRTVQNLWRTDSQSKNALEISREAANMLDKFSAFVSDLDEVGRQIGRADEAYQKARNKLDSGKGNLINRAHKLEKLGAKGKKKLPETNEDVD